jgi:hypothetical protein
MFGRCVPVVWPIRSSAMCAVQFSCTPRCHAILVGGVHLYSPPSVSIPQDLTLSLLCLHACCTYSTLGVFGTFLLAHFETVFQYIVHQHRPHQSAPAVPRSSLQYLLLLLRCLIRAMPHSSLPYLTPGMSCLSLCPTQLRSSHIACTHLHFAATIYKCSSAILLCN